MVKEKVKFYFISILGSILSIFLMGVTLTLLTVYWGRDFINLFLGFPVPFLGALILVLYIKKENYSLHLIVSTIVSYISAIVLSVFYSFIVYPFPLSSLGSYISVGSRIGLLIVACFSVGTISGFGINALRNRRREKKSTQKPEFKQTFVEIEKPFSITNVSTTTIGKAALVFFFSTGIIVFFSLGRSINPSWNRFSFPYFSGIMNIVVIIILTLYWLLFEFVTIKRKLFFYLITIFPSLLMMADLAYFIAGAIIPNSTGFLGEFSTIQLVLYLCFIVCISFAIKNPSYVEKASK